MCFSSCSIRFWASVSLNKLFKQLKNWSFTRINCFLFFNNWWINFVVSKLSFCCTFYIISISTIYKCPILSSKITLSSKKLIVSQEISLLSFIQPVGNGFVIAIPYWLFSSSLRVLVIIFFFNFLIVYF